MADYSIMSLNLKNTGPLNIGSMAFEDRVSSIEELICWNDPDLIGIQELTDDMIPFLPHTFDAYQFYGKARGNEDLYANERCCILFKKDRFDILSGSTFWLSDTPDKCGSFYPGSIYPRIATIGILQDLYIETAPMRGRKVEDITPDDVHLAITEARVLDADSE